jgi:hypothetical protein
MISMLTSVLLVLIAAPSLADDAPSAGLIEQLELANKLIALGDARKDPLLLIAAARIQKSLDNQAIAAPAADAATRSVLDRARLYAGNRKDLIGLADDVAAQKSKGHALDCFEVQSRPCGKAILY